MNARSQRGFWAAVALLVVFGLIRLPIEHQLDEEARAAGFRTARLDLDMRERLTQLTFLAALSGFRALVADILWIKAYTAFENAEWGRMSYLLETVTSLQPRSEMFWDLAHWHMAFNASAWAMHDADIPREALRVKAQQEFIEIGRDFLERGIRNNPDSSFLHERLGLLLQDKFKDPCAAAASFAEAAALPGATEYVKRFAAYELAKCPGREREAYEKLLALYREGEQERKPTLVRLLTELEQTLGIPEEQRIYKTGAPGQDSSSDP